MDLDELLANLEEQVGNLPDEKNTEQKAEVKKQPKQSQSQQQQEKIANANSIKQQQEIYQQELLAAQRELEAQQQQDQILKQKEYQQQQHQKQQQEEQQLQKQQQLQQQHLQQQQQQQYQAQQQKQTLQQQQKPPSLQPQQPQQPQQSQKPQQFQQPQLQQQQISEPQMTIIDKESMYTKPSQFKSISLLAQEINFISNTIQKQTNISNNAKFSGFYNNLNKGLQQQLSQLIEFVESGKLRSGMYGKFITDSMKAQKELFGLAQQNKESFFIKRIANRMNLLQSEFTLMKQNQDENFVQIVKKVKPNTAIPSGGSENQAARPKAMIDKNDLKNFQTDMNAQKFQEANIDNQPTHVKYEALLKRYKEYYNYVLYLSNNVKDKRKETIDLSLKLLEKGKFLREAFIKGENPPVGNFLVNEMQELTLEAFHEMNVQQYKNAQVKIFNQLFEGNNKEREFQKIALHSKRIQIGKNQTYNPHEESKSRLNAYGQAFDHLKQLQVCQWILLPEIETQDLKVPICIENKEIPPNVIRVKFIKLSNCKYEKYYLTFSLETSKGILSKQTEICDKNCVFNFDLDIPQQPNVDYAEKFIEVRLFEKGFFGSSEIGVNKFSLGDIKNKTVFEGAVSFDNKKQPISLSYNLQIREPLEKYIQLQLQFVKLSKCYPLFDAKEGSKDFLEKFMPQLPNYEEYRKLQEQKKLKEVEEVKLKEQQKILEAQKIQQQQQQQQQQAAISQQFIFLDHMDTNPELIAIKSYLSTNPQLPPELTANDILYPENPAKFPIINFINQYEGLANQKSIELKQEPSLKQWSRFCQNMWEDFLRQKTIINRKLENEDFEWYFGKIRNLMPMEQFLLDTYKKLNLQQWVQFIETRKGILEQELKELEGMMNE